MQCTRRRTRTASVALALLVLLGCAQPSYAQEAEFADHGSLLGSTLKGVVTDPTTYAPSALFYSAMMLDWQSSQPFFAHGFVEENPRFTLNGLPHDTPVSVTAGRRRVLRDALGVMPAMLANNAASHLIERSLARRHPEHRAAFRVLGVVQRVALSALVSYRLSASHFQQWQRNQRLAAELGYR
jgi:hypothetical protein